MEIYAKKANRVVIKHRHGEVVAVIAIVSPGNKNSHTALRSFVRKGCELLDNGIHLLIVDLFPPSDRDPQGFHEAIWDEIREEPFELPEDKPLTVVACSAGPPKTACIEPVTVGDTLPEMPFFLAEGWCVLAPLEETYQATWADCPGPIRELLEPGTAGETPRGQGRHTRSPPGKGQPFAPRGPGSPLTSPRPATPAAPALSCGCCTAPRRR